VRGTRDRVAVTHQHKIGHLLPYLEIQWPGHVPHPPRQIPPWLRQLFLSLSVTLRQFFCQLFRYYASSFLSFFLFSFLYFPTSAVVAWRFIQERPECANVHNGSLNPDHNSNLRRESRAGNGSIGHGSMGQTGHFFGWVIWVMGRCMLTHDPLFCASRGC